MMSDKQRLDFLQKITGSYTGMIICRRSKHGRGWRLHESSKDKAVFAVREAIENMIKQEKEVNDEHEE